MKSDAYGASSIAEQPRAEKKQVSQAPAQGDKQEMMKKMELAGTPGPAHKALDAFVGNWKAEVKCWTDPGGPPNVSQGTARTKWVLNGRFVEEEFQGEMMGKPFHGRSLLGYDNTKQTFNSVWVDDLHTSMFTSEGKGENANKVITLEGKATCPATGRRDIAMKQVLRVISPEKHVFEMFDGSKGNAKTLEITYSRQ